ncbi:MAG: murein biosynthesis integral membrane protein MurJ [Kiritimatiellia bacterium]|jgi:putative peptidoglycan lipid II flippase
MSKPASVNENVLKVGSLTGLSRVLGLVREMLTSRLVGAGLYQSAFVFAFTIPNLFRKFFGEGALSVAFVPVFKEEIEQGRRESAEQLARAVSSAMASILALICLVAILVITAVLPTVEPDGRVSAVLRMTRIMLPYAVFICTAAFAMGVQNAHGRFARAAAAPSILNIVWIGTLIALFFFPDVPVRRRVFIVAWAVLVSGILQLAFLLHAVWRNGIRLLPTAVGWNSALARTVWRNTGIGVIGMGAVQINLVLDNVLALWAAPWAPAAISYAERLVYLPLGIVATAFATVLLPTLAGHFAHGDLDGAKTTFLTSVEDVLLLAIPAAAGLMLLSHDIVTIIYQGGEFKARDALRVSRALFCYAPGLLFFSLNKILTPWFHAQKDMKTPVRVSLAMVGANFTLNVLMVLTLPVEWKHAGIAGSTVVCSLASSAFLAGKASQRNGHMGLRALLKPARRMTAACLLMIAAVACVRHQVYATMGTGRLASLTVVGAGIVAAVAVYGVAVWLLCPDATRRVLMIRRHPRHRTNPT